MSSKCDLRAGLLQSYYDGELLFDERAKVEAHLEACSDCRVRLEALRELSEAVRSANDVMMEDLSFDGFFDRIAAEIETDRTRDTVGETTPLWERIRDAIQTFLGAHKPILATSLMTAALVTLVFVFFFGDHEPRIIERKETVIVQPPQVIVESVAYDDNSSVLISSTPDDETTVIWLLDNEQAPSDLMPRLKERIRKKKRELRDNPI